MQRRLLKLLQDIQSHALSITELATGLALNGYQANKIIRLAVEREFEIVGEALRRMSDEYPDVFARITHARRIVGFRNVLAHGYDIVDDGVVWDIVQTHLPILRGEVEGLIGETKSD